MVRQHIAHISVVLIFVIFICGCAHQSANQSTTPNPDAIDSKGKAITFKVRLHYLNLENGISEEPHIVVNTITINLVKNEILWGQIPVRVVKPNLFFVEENKKNGWTALLGIKGKSTDGNNAVTIIRDASAAGHALIQSCQTPNGSFDEFYSYFNRIQFSENYYGLIATTKYIDGTPMKIGYEFPASIQLLDKGCLLNEKAARFYRSKLENGNGVIIVNNDDSNLILWADGNWIYYNLSDSDTRFGGTDDSLIQVYAELRLRTKEPAADRP
jgi:hypothetical protein